VAEFAGYVAKVEVAVGDQVNSGQSLLTLYPVAGLEVRAKLPATQQDEFVSALRTWAPARRPLPWSREKSLQFTLARSAAAADARGLDAFFVASRPAANLRVGELVTLEVARAPVPDVVAVPYAALFGGRQLYRIVDGRLQALDVTVLGDAGGTGDSGNSAARLLVKSPELKQGDLLLTTHLPNAVSGLKVEVVK
jgi:HlyD family secretion protein